MVELNFIMPKRTQINVKIDDWVLDHIKMLVDIGIYKNQSDFIREAVRLRVLDFIQNFGEELKKEFNKKDEELQLYKDFLSKLAKSQ